MTKITFDDSVTVRQKQAEWMVFTRDELSYALDKYHDTIIAKKSITNAKSAFLAMTSFSVSGLITFLCSEFKAIGPLSASKVELIFLLAQFAFLVLGVLGFIIIAVWEKVRFSETKHERIKEFVNKEAENRPVTTKSAN